MKRLLFTASLFLLAITGFAQMPIFKRYYIADIPGLGWLAEFYTTHFLHYAAAVAFLAASGYLLTEFILLTRAEKKISASGALRGFLLGAIALTGAFLVARNRMLAPFSPSAVIAIDLAHLGLVMLFLAAAVFCRIFRLSWTVTRQPAKPARPPR